MSPGTKQLSRFVSYLGGGGLVLWMLSGYGVFSLPVWYGGTAALTGLYSLRCCHDDKVSGGVPHCYKPKARKLEDVLVSAQTRLQSLAGKIAKDPKGWFKKTFL